MATAPPADPNAAAFHAMLPNLLKQHEGKFALIHDATLAGVFDSMDGAYDHAVQTFGVDPIFIGHITSRPKVEEAPALYHGLIRARI